MVELLKSVLPSSYSYNYEGKFKKILYFPTHIDTEISSSSAQKTSKVKIYNRAGLFSGWSGRKLLLRAGNIASGMEKEPSGRDFKRVGHNRHIVSVVTLHRRK